MLVLSRKKGESIIIQDEIEITILDIARDHIKLGIKAPKDMSVYRKEVLESIKDENQRASSIITSKLQDLTQIFKKN